MKRMALAALFVLLGVLSLYQAVSAQSAPMFRLGFKTLADMIPDVVGSPLENEHFNPANGDALQQTSTGLMVWRKADNWTAFTNGNMSWINGPNGLQSRPNGQRFDWENDTVAPAAVPSPTPSPSPAPTSVAGPTSIKANCSTGLLDPFSASGPSPGGMVCLGDELQLLPAPQSGWWDSYYMTPKTLPSGDFELYVDIRFASNVPAYAGLTFDHTGFQRDDKYYRLWVTNTGAVSLSLDNITNSNNTAIAASLNAQGNPAKFTPDRPNRLKVQRSGSKLTVSLNDYVLGTFENATVRGTVAGYIAMAYDKPGADIRLNNFSYTVFK